MYHSLDLSHVLVSGVTSRVMTLVTAHAKTLQKIKKPLGAVTSWGHNSHFCVKCPMSVNCQRGGSMWSLRNSASSTGFSFGSHSRLNREIKDQGLNVVFHPVFLKRTTENVRTDLS